MATKRRRGRPDLFDRGFPDDPEAAARMRSFREQLYPNMSARNRANYHYAVRTQSLLTDDKHKPIAPWVSYFWGDRPDGTSRYRLTIMAELGRIEDDEMVITVAKLVADENYSVREAVRRVRRARLAGHLEVDGGSDE